MSDDAAVWSRPALLHEVLRRRHDGFAELALRIPALAHPRQALRLERVLQALPGVSRMSFDVAAQRARLVVDDALIPLPRLLEACAGAGCEARPLHRDVLDVAGRRLLDASLRRLLVAGLFAMQAMTFALVLYLGGSGGLDTTTAQAFRWLAMFAATPVVAYAAWPFYRDAVASLRAGSPGIDVPVALAVVAIYAASCVNALRGGGEVYFDSVSMFVFVLMLGRHLDLRSQVRHRALGEVAADAVPLVARRWRADGVLESVAAAELVPGDCVQVAEGESVPCDGVLENAYARTDEALLSGEARATTHVRGEAIPAGSVALGAPLKVRITRGVTASTTTLLANLATMVGAGGDTNLDAPVVRRFVWRVLVLAAATAAFWLWRDPARAFEATVAVLVVACPCAFGLAAPAVRTRAMAVLAHLGVLVTRPGALSPLAVADRALFDKTGTLAEPALDVGAIETFRGTPHRQALAQAAALAAGSHHPMAIAVLCAAGDATTLEAREVEVVPAGGIRGRIGGKRFRLGRSEFVGGVAVDDDALWLGDDAGPLARWPITESVHARVPTVFAALRAQGIASAIVSGDAPWRVRMVASKLGVEDWSARQSPEDKLARVRVEQQAGHVVLVVGDGSNDAPALAAADVSVAVPGGTSLAKSHADLVLLHGLAELPAARGLAAQARTILMANRRWSLVWNLGAVPFAALGFVPPWLAMIGMSASSLVVVLNALRIGARWRAPPAPGAPQASSA